MTAEQIADKLLALINSQPRTPTREEIVAILVDAIPVTPSRKRFKLSDLLESEELRRSYVGEYGEYTLVDLAWIYGRHFQALDDALRGTRDPSEWRVKWRGES